MFKVNNKDTRTTPLASSVSIVNFEHVHVDWVVKYFIKNVCNILKIKCNVALRNKTRTE